MSPSSSSDSNAAAKPSSQPRSFKVNAGACKRDLLQDRVTDRTRPEARNSLQKGVLRLVGEPQALRPESAIVVIVHLLAENSGNRSLAAVSEVPLSGGHGHCFEALEPRLCLEPLEGFPGLNEQRAAPPASARLCKPLAVLEQDDRQPEARADLT